MRRLASERGAVSTEFAVIMAAFLTSFMLLVVFAGRVATAENHVRAAAQEAARSASLAGTPEAAVAAAQQTAAGNLTSSGLTCASGLDVAVDIAQFVPGGWVGVTVSCDTPFSDVASLSVPGTKTFTGTATEVIDTYRSDP